MMTNSDQLQSILQSILASRKSDTSGNIPVQLPSMQGQQTPIPQGIDQQQSPFSGLQAFSKLLGYGPNTTFGYDMSGIAPQPQGPTQTGAPLQNPSMNLQQAMSGQGIMGLLSNLFGMA